MNRGGASGRDEVFVPERFEDFRFADTVVVGHLGGGVSSPEAIVDDVGTHACACQHPVDRTRCADSSARPWVVLPRHLVRRCGRQYPAQTKRPVDGPDPFHLVLQLL